MGRDIKYFAVDSTKQINQILYDSQILHPSNHLPLESCVKHNSGKDKLHVYIFLSV